MNERLRILEAIESGEISVEEGVRRLEGLSQGGADRALQPEDDTAAAAATVADEPAPEPAAWPFVRIIWQIVFGVGVAVVAVGGLLVARAYGREGLPGLTWGWIVLALGLLVMLLGWWLQRAHWFYLRVREHEGAAFTIALPLPVGLVMWLLRVAKPYVPKLQEMNLEQLILAMEDELRDGRPVAITVDEGEAGDQVEMHIR
jgi:hypothetical protein